MEPDASSRGNPYDFRSPVRQSSLLAGRQDELAEIDALLRESAAGRQAHFSLFGAQGVGKSSLLNSVVELARDRGFLAVKVLLRESAVESEVAFYQAIYEAALQELLDRGKLESSDDVMQTWLMQTCTGAGSCAASADSLELGLLIGAKVEGRMISAVPVTVVGRDMARLLTRQGDPCPGIVLCFDGAERLDDNRDLAESLIGLVEVCPALTIVTAAETAGTLQAAAPRAWAQVEVGPFRDPGDVMDAMAKPMSDGGDRIGSGPPTPATAMDIRQLTGGVPYEVNLVCHFIWEAIQQGEQDDFELSAAVIEKVRAELEEKGRHEASREIATFSGLSEEDYGLLVELAPFESLSVRKLALMRLMLSDYADADLVSAEETVARELEHLQDRGVIRVEHDWFTVLGGKDARMYLKYAAQKHTGKKLRYASSYARTAVHHCAADLGDALTDAKRESRTIFGRSRPQQEVGGPAIGAWLDRVTTAAAASDLVTLANHVAPGVHPEDILQHGGANYVLIGLHLQAEVHDIEHVMLLANPDSLSIEDLRQRAADWASSNADLLSKFEVRVVGCRCEELSDEVLRASVAYWFTGLMCQVSYMAYTSGAPDAAEALLESVVTTAEELVGESPGDPLIRSQFAEVLHRQGFMAATRGDWATAVERLDRSASMALEEYWLLDYNRAYVHAAQGKFARAAELCARAVDAFVQRDTDFVLHGYFPTPPQWDPPGHQWNALMLRGAWVSRFLELQLVVMQALASADAHAALELATEGLSGASPAPLSRLAGWARLTILNDADGAAELFARAALAASYQDTELPLKEHAFARSAAADAASANEL